MAARTRVNYDDKILRQNVRNFDSNFRRALRVVVDRRAAETEAWMKKYAPWTDRTGAARTGLLAVPIHGASFEEIFMAYSVHYGIWLEVANDRRFAIIQPAIRIQGAALMRDMKLLIDAMESAALRPNPTPGIARQPDKPGRHTRNHPYGNKGHH